MIRSYKMLTTKRKLQKKELLVGLSKILDRFPDHKHKK